MKSNVDLTENRDFGDIHSGARFDTLNRESPNLHEILLTGTKEKRMVKKIARSFCLADNHCDCCGDTNPLHFIYKDSLCDECSARVSESKLWWR